MREKNLTVKEYFEKYSDDGISCEVLHHDDGTPVLWIKKHSYGLTVVDCGNNVRGLNYRDESDKSLDRIVAEWKQCVSWDVEEGVEEYDMIPE